MTGNCCFIRQVGGWLYSCMQWLRSMHMDKSCIPVCWRQLAPEILLTVWGGRHPQTLLPGTLDDAHHTASDETVHKASHVTCWVGCSSNWKWFPRLCKWEIFILQLIAQLMTVWIQCHDMWAPTDTYKKNCITYEPSPKEFLPCSSVNMMNLLLMKTSISDTASEVIHSLPLHHVFQNNLSRGREAQLACMPNK